MRILNAAETGTYTKSIQSVHNLVALGVFLSGASALMYEITWQRVLVRLLGGTLPAVTLILAVFMGGMALGAGIAARSGDRVRDPLKLFSWLEFGLGSFGLLFPLLTTQASLSVVLGIASSCATALFHVDPVIAYSTMHGAFLINALLTIAAIALLLIATVAMGATFPLCARAVEQLADYEKEVRASGVRSKPASAGDDLDVNAPDSANSLNGGDQFVTYEISRLYLLNLVGAALGSLASAYVLLPWVGIADTIRAAAGLNLVTSLVLQLTHRYLLLTLSRVSESDRPENRAINDESPEHEAVKPDSTAAATNQLPVPTAKRILQMCTIAGVFAALALGLQVAWSRLFALLYGSSTYSVAAVIGSSLIGLGCGCALTRLFLLRRARFRVLLSTCSAIASLLMTLDLFLFGQLPLWLPRLELGLAHVMSPVASYLIARCLFIMLIVLPQTAMLGTITPFLLGRLVRHGHKTAWITGQLMMFTTLGSIFGSVTTGWLIIPMLVPLHIFPFTAVSGMQNAFVIAAVVEALIAIAAVANVLQDSTEDERAPQDPADAKKFRIRIFAIAVASVCSLALAIFHPHWNPSAMSSGISSVPVATLKRLSHQQIRNLVSGKNSNLLFYKEGSSSTVTVAATNDRNVIYLKNDGKVEAALPLDKSLPAPTSDENTQVLLGVLPTLISPLKPESAFLIGYGSGTTAGAILRSPDVSSLTIAELEPAVFQAGAYFERVNNRPLRGEWRRSGRVTAVVADARNLLALSTRQYNIIVSQPAEPWTTGSADLYSLEFWKLAKSRLEDRGIFCQWLQLYSIDSNHLAVLLRTFSTIFPNVVLFHEPRSGEMLIIGFEDDADKLDAELLQTRIAAFAQPNVLGRLGIDSSQDLLDLVIGTPESVKTFCVAKQSITHDSRINTDNNLVTEYMIPTTIFTARDTVQRNLSALELVTPKETIAFAGSAKDAVENSFRKGQTLFEQKRLEEALAVNTVSLKDSPSCAKCHVQRALIMIELHKTDQAMNELRASLAIDPNQYDVRMLLARCAVEKNDAAEALQLYKQASDCEPSQIEPFIAIVTLFTLKNDWQPALANLQLIQRRDPNNREGRILACIVYDGLGNQKQSQSCRAGLADLSNRSVEQLKRFMDERLRSSL